MCIRDRLAAVGALYSSSKSKGPRASASAGGLTLMEAGESDFAAASAGVFGARGHTLKERRLWQLTRLASKDGAARRTAGGPSGGGGPGGGPGGAGGGSGGSGGGGRMSMPCSSRI